MKQPNYGYYTEKIQVHVRADWVEKLEAIVTRSNRYGNKQDVIREAIRQFFLRGDRK